MKKLNTKGFTLIELLAVIVVLAIVMVIAVTSVLNSTRNAAKNAIENSAKSVANYAKQQEQLFSIGLGAAETCYQNWRSGKDYGEPYKIGKEYATCFGLNNTDYDLDNSTMVIYTDGTAEIMLCATTDGKFSNIATPETDLGGSKKRKCVYLRK